MKNKILFIPICISIFCLIASYVNIIDYITALIFIIIILIFTLCFLVIQQRKEIDVFTEHIIDIIDHAYNNTYVYQNNDETIESKIQFKLNKLLDKVNYEIDQSRQSQDKIQALITDLSHQVKTPLTNIKLYLDILQKKEASINNIDFYKKLDLQVEKLEFLMNSIIKISRLENDIITIVPKPNNIKETVFKTITDVYYKAESKDIFIDYKPTDYIAIYDEKWTIEAISNVLDNAVKYSNPHSTITIECENTEFYCILKIIDQGIGINKNEFNNIFKRFYRENDKHNYEGIGIGLYLTREILSLEHGYISVKSEKNIGSCFSIYLPIC